MQIVLELDEATAEQVCAAFGKLLGSVEPNMGVSIDAAGSTTVDISAQPTPRPATPGEVKTWLISQVVNIVTQMHEADRMEQAQASARASAAAISETLNIL